jgi:hypothetical protein
MNWEYFTEITTITLPRIVLYIIMLTAIKGLIK